MSCKKNKAHCWHRASGFMCIYRHCCFCDKWQVFHEYDYLPKEGHGEYYRVKTKVYEWRKIRISKGDYYPKDFIAYTGTTND